MHNGRLPERIIVAVVVEEPGAADLYPSSCRAFHMIDRDDVRVWGMAALFIVGMATAAFNGPGAAPPADRCKLQTTTLDEAAIC